MLVVPSTDALTFKPSYRSQAIGTAETQDFTQTRAKVDQN